MKTLEENKKVLENHMATDPMFININLRICAKFLLNARDEESFQREWSKLSRTVKSVFEECGIEAE